MELKFSIMELEFRMAELSSDGTGISETLMMQWNFCGTEVLEDGNSVPWN